jgi:hypothetical protein
LKEVVFIGGLEPKQHGNKATCKGTSSGTEAGDGMLS